MPSNKKITDEMLARYISGLASPEEEADVLDYMAESDEHVNDLINIADIVRMQQESEAAKDRQHRPTTRWVWATAASVALLMAVGATWYFTSLSGKPTIVAQVEEDTISIPTAEEVAPSLAPDKPLVAKADNNATRPAEIVEEGYTIHREQQATASQMVDGAETMEVTFPRRQREVCSWSEPFTFTFHCPGSNSQLIFTDPEGNTIMVQDVTGTDSYTLRPSLLGNVSEVVWTLRCSLPDGTTQRRSGKLQILN